MGMPFDLIWLAVSAYVVLQVLVMMWSSGKTRVAAALPILVMVPVFAMTIVGFVQENNLWPLLLLFASPVALVYVVVVALVVRLNRKQTGGA